MLDHLILYLACYHWIDISDKKGENILCTYEKNQRDLLLTKLDRLHMNIEGGFFSNT